MEEKKNEVKHKKVSLSSEETFGNILLEVVSRYVTCIGDENAGVVLDTLGRGGHGIIFDITNARAIHETLVKMNETVVPQQIRQNTTKKLKEIYSGILLQKNALSYLKDTIKK